MLELEILKFEHKNAESARVIVPYITQTDVYALEQAAGIKSDADSFEMDWAEILKDNITRSKLKKIVESENKFRDQELIYAHRNNIGIYFSERFTDIDAVNIKRLHEKSDFFQSTAVNFLIEGNIEKYLIVYYTGLNLLKNAIGMRDREIAKNLTGSEEYLKSIYPWLRNKDTIKITLGIGYLHKPEEFIDQEVTVHLLVDEKEDIITQTAKQLRTDLDFESLRTPMLRMGLYVLSRENLLDINEQEIRRMNLSDLVDQVKKHTN